MPVEKKRTTLGIKKSTKQRFSQAKPYDSLSDDEFIDTLLDKWEGRR